MSAIPVLSLSAIVGEEEAELRTLHVGWKSLMMNCQSGQANGDAVTINRNHDDAENVRRSLKADHRLSCVQNGMQMNGPGSIDWASMGTTTVLQTRDWRS